MKKFLLILAILAVAGYGAWKTGIMKPRPISEENTTETAPLVGFSWQYEPVSLPTSDMSYTRIILNATYENGQILSKEIDIFPGSCNEVDPKKSEDQDMMPDTQKIQCYAAGLGYWFKITQTDSYVVLRKMFEEASPDYNPPTYTYEAIAEFPLLY